MTGMSRPTLDHGFCDLLQPDFQINTYSTRQKGAGRKKATACYPELLSSLESLVDPLSRGDPESPLRRTVKSTRVLSEELSAMGYKVCKSKVATLLTEIGYSLQSNRKTLEGKQHADRNAQFEHINAKAQSYIEMGNPVISVDTKKKENVGNQGVLTLILHFGIFAA
jgi:hypothetical protein